MRYEFLMEKMKANIHRNSFDYLIKYIYVGIILQVSIVKCNSFTIPTPTAKALSPKGFRVSIPDANGIALFAFHGNINRVFYGTEAGEYNGETRQKIGHEWIFETERYKLKSGDVLHCWIYVQHDKHAYQMQKQFTFPDDFEGRGAPVSPVLTGRMTTTAAPVTHPKPIVTVRPTTSTTTTASTPHKVTPSPGITTTTSSPQPGCKPSITTMRYRKVDCAGKLIFEEHFENATLANWQPDVRMPLDTGDAEFVLYHKYPDVWNVSNSNLYIFPKIITDFPEFTEEQVRKGHLDLKEECTFLQDYTQECTRAAFSARILPPVVSAAISTRKTFSFKYGKIEMRAKLPKGDWLFPQLNLDPVDSTHYGTTGYANGQIRVAFIRGNEYLDNKESAQISGNRLTGGIVIATGEYHRNSWLKQASLQANHLGDAFHTYSISWTNEQITFSLDGELYAIIKGGLKNQRDLLDIPHVAQWQRGTDMAPFDREFYITLGVAAGGLSDFPDGSVTGISRQPKPWENTSPKAELSFFKAKNKWRPTWKSNEAGLIVDYVKVWSI